MKIIADKMIESDGRILFKTGKERENRISISFTQFSGMHKSVYVCE